MEIQKTELEGVLVITPRVFCDVRGSFQESYSARTFVQSGIHTVFVQDNLSRTEKKDTIRGIHFQNYPKAQTKLVRCTRGRVLDIVVDLRRGSPTFTKWIATELSEENNRQLYIPKGFGHLFVSLTDSCDFLYKVDEFYAPEYDRSILWSDPQICISLDIANPLLSDKDARAPLLSQSDMNFTMENCG